jgi:HAMP domain-containing protein
MASNTNEKKPRHLLYVGIGTKMLILFGLLFGVLFLVSYLWFFNFATSLARQDVARELISIAAAVARNINGDDYAALVASDVPGVAELIETEGEEVVTQTQYWGIEDPRYRELVNSLNLFRQMSGTVTDLNGEVRNRVGIYTYVATETEGVVLFIGSASAANTPPGGARFRSEYQTQPAPGAPNYMWEGLSSPIANVEHAIPDEFGTWYSGFAPIYDSQGNIVGAVGVDLRDTTVQALQRQIQEAMLPAAIVALVVLLASVAFISYSISRPIAILTRSAERVAEGDYSEEVITPSRALIGDETALLTDVFDMMVDKVRERQEKLKQQVAELQVIIDEAKREKEVRDIVETEFFQELQRKSAALRARKAQIESGAITPESENKPSTS